MTIETTSLPARGRITAAAAGDDTLRRRIKRWSIMQSVEMSATGASKAATRPSTPWEGAFDEGPTADFDSEHLRHRVGAVEARLDETVTLPDGRRLGVAEVGESAGIPVLYFHGVPGSRLDFASERCDEALRTAGVRFIGVDRPGFGLSDPKPGRGHADWPSDASAVADARGLDRFAALGYSRGGRYALACAALIPERLTAVGVLSGVGSPDMDGFRRAFPRLVRMDHAFARRAPALWTRITNSTVRRARKSPAALLAPLKLVLRSPADRAALAAYPLEFARCGIEAARSSPEAWRLEETNMPDPLGFDLDGVTMPVRIWHGSADTLVPIAHARHLAARLASAELVELSHVGHLHTPERIAQIAAELTRTSRWVSRER